LEGLKIGNSVYAKRTTKRLVAQAFRMSIATYDIDKLDAQTRNNINDQQEMSCSHSALERAGSIENDEAR
jgi:hypothetical protein